MKYGKWSLGQTEALINTIGGIEVAEGILNGSIRILLERVSFPVWMTAEIGGLCAENLITTMESNGISIGHWAKDILGKPAFTTLPEKRTLKLARCKLRDLGFTQQPTTTELQERIKVFGGSLCPAELGPHLRLQFKDQEKGGMCWLLMQQIADSVGNPTSSRWSGTLMAFCGSMRAMLSRVISGISTARLCSSSQVSSLGLYIWSFVSYILNPLRRVFLYTTLFCFTESMFGMLR